MAFAGKVLYPWCSKVRLGGSPLTSSSSLLTLTLRPRHALYNGLRNRYLATTAATAGSSTSTKSSKDVTVDEILRSAERLDLNAKMTLLRSLEESVDEANAAEAGTSVDPPTNGDLGRYALRQALPFVGFGFLDNLIMILAGEYIDHTIGLTLGISTMAAAGLGNAISDVFGVGSAWYVEHWCNHLGIRVPDFSRAQLAHPRTRLVSNAAKAGGVAVGCLIGMFPLFFQ